jgi:hypothetical protein
VERHPTAFGEGSCSKDPIAAGLPQCTWPRARCSLRHPSLDNYIAPREFAHERSRYLSVNQRRRQKHTNVSFVGDLRGSGESYYRPVFWISLALDRMLWEMNPVAFHLTNLALRWLNGCLLFAVLKKAGVPMELAAYTVLVWLTLPINSEVVAWVSARAYLLAALFVLVSALLAELFLERRRTIAVASYTLTALLALLSH